MEVHIVIMKTFVSLAIVGFLGLVLRFYKTAVVDPARLQSKLRKQGIPWATAEFSGWKYRGDREVPSCSSGEGSGWKWKPSHHARLRRRALPFLREMEEDLR
ncbi:hypothetical protein U1Q18_014665 [Sarracenia purpurea var. burkii]